jgi:hypothetical protein
LPIQIQAILAESVYMSGQIRAETGQRIRVQPHSFLSHLVEGFGHRAHVIKDQTVGHQMIVLDQLPLLIAVVFGQQPSAERHPLSEEIEILTLVQRADRNPTKFQIRNPIEQKLGAHNPADLPKRAMKAILPIV